MKIGLEIQYNGSAFHGWQVQPGCRTVQQTLQCGLEQLLGASCGVTGCSRTDRGVHAEQFICAVQTATSVGIPPERIPLALNAILPSDLVAVRAFALPESFHPRYSAIGKRYEYRILHAPVPDPFSAGLCYYYPRALQVDRMAEAAQYFCGTHDFTSFCAAASDVEDKVRLIRECSVTDRENRLTVAVEGNGFLYNMVRIIVGTLLGVSEGRYLPTEIPSILAARDRSRAGMTVSPEGLYLTRVLYPEEFGI